MSAIELEEKHTTMTKPDASASQQSKVCQQNILFFIEFHSIFNLNISLFPYKLQGFFLGFFVGFMMIFWVWLPTVSHKQKLGIMTGLCCHLVLKLAQDTSAVEDRTAVVDLMQEISDGY